MSEAKFPIYFLWSIILCSACTDKVQAVATAIFPMTKSFCTSLSLQSVFLYHLQPHGQREHTIATKWLCIAVIQFCNAYCVMCITWLLYKYNRTLIKAAVVLLPLLGLTWIFGLLAVNVHLSVFTWLFTILNSLQVSLLILCGQENVSFSTGFVHFYLSCDQIRKGTW